MKTSSKYYFQKYDENCYPIQYHLDYMKENNLLELEVFRGIPNRGIGYFFCKKFLIVGESGTCGKMCEEYIPRSTHGGSCHYHSMVYEQGKSRILRIPEQWDALPNEIWKDISGFEGLYQASTLGRVRSFDKTLTSGLWNQETVLLKGRIIKSLDGRGGYLKVSLTNKSGKYIQITLHRLIGKTFIPNPENKPQINHKNAIRTDCRVENLEWVTDSENKRHAIEYLGNCKGERVGTHKLTAAQVLEIREMYKDQYYNPRVIGEKYGVSRNSIIRIIEGKSWKHLIT